MTKISIQGNLGSYSHIAANSIFGEGIKLLERDSFQEVFEDLNEDRAEAIVVPVENSTHGTVYQNYDNLTAYDFIIIGEIYLKINFYLISHADSTFGAINTLYSHPVGLNQIKGFLRENPQIAAKEYPDTAGSVKMVKENNLENEAAAASRFAAEIYGMKILKENIQENKKNFTRFFIITKKSSEEKFKTIVDVKSENAYKTTIQFVLGKEAGSLYKALGVFATRNIALTKIESRPILNTEWEYRFYVDVLANIEDVELKNALEEIIKYVDELRILGRYREGIYIDT